MGVLGGFRGGRLEFMAVGCWFGGVQGSCVGVCKGRA